jgi:cAMP phosphodiesterase
MAQDTSANEEPRYTPDDLRTNGVKHNRKLQFTFSLTGHQVYNVLQTFEEIAVSHPHFDVVRKCVLLSEEIRNQAKEQGF